MHRVGQAQKLRWIGWQGTIPAPTREAKSLGAHEPDQIGLVRSFVDSEKGWRPAVDWEQGVSV